jgi:hypothetical protein
MSLQHSGARLAQYWRLSPQDLETILDARRTASLRISLLDARGANRRLSQEPKNLS